jgi:inosose dehydratase
MDNASNETRNIKLSYMTNMWGMVVQFPRINDFNEWYKVDGLNSAYFLDWEHIIKYIVANGFQGMELMWHMRPWVDKVFGSPQSFAAFVEDLGLEKVSGCFDIAEYSEDRTKQDYVVKRIDAIIDFTAALGGEYIQLMPSSGYYPVGPLSREQVQNCADCINIIGKHAADKGIDICLHTEFWCAINKYDVERFVEEMTDRDTVSFCLDTAQVSIMGFDPIELYERWRDRIRSFHIKDTTEVDTPDEDRFKAGAEFCSGNRWFWELGAGKVDFPKLWGLFKKYHQKGWVSIETDGTPDALATTTLTKYYIDRVLTPIYR